VDVALAALGAAQWGVVALEDLLALGLSQTAIRKRAAAGRLHRLHRGIYSLIPPNLLSREGRWLAAVLACGPGAVLSHRSAAALHRLRATGATRIEVAVPTRSHRVHTGLNIHRSKTLIRADTTTVQNIPCTTVARTLLDLAEAVDRRAVERACDQAEILELFDLRAVNDILRRNATRRGAKVIRAVLDEHYIGSTITWSELEERFLKLVREAGLPRPEVNVWVVLPDGGPPIRGDFVWRAQQVIIETDGYETHRSRWAFERDRRRDQRTSAAGWRPIRTTMRQLERAPEEIVATARALMRL
jgi:predicted transcriptional regulator of viral defense system